MLVQHLEVLSELYNTYHSRIVYREVACSQLEGLDLQVGFDPGLYRFEVNWGSGEKAFEPIMIRDGKITISDYQGEQESFCVLSLPAEPFPSFPKATLFSPVVSKPHYSARITVELNVVEGRAPTMLDSAVIAATFTEHCLAREPNDVCFYFPRTGRRLWANENALRKKSPYFDNLLSSDFAENSTSFDSSASTTPLDPYTFDDSDIETDSHNIHRSTLTDPERSKTFPFKTIKVTDTACSTYLSVLLWISTGYIAFAPLLSLFRGQTPIELDNLSGRRQAIDKLKEEATPGLPSPVSPKSVYRLAHLLELDDLATLALANYRFQLAARGAMYELYGDVSRVYPEIQKIAMAFVVKNWKEVKGTIAMKKIEESFEGGEGDSATALIGVKLAKNLMERHAK